MVLGLLTLPVAALIGLSDRLDLRWVAAVLFALSGLTFWMYRDDKRRAEAGAWRIPESTLHLLGALGDWPGGWLAQRKFRHKTAKLSFAAVFWLTVASHQYLAADRLLDWRMTRAGWHFLRTRVT